MVYCDLHHTLHMRTALFLGAGASAFAGLPTTVELMDSVRKRVRNEKGGRGMSQTIERIIHNDDYTDVEKLYDGIDGMLRLPNDTPNTKPIFDVLCDSDGMFQQTLDELRHTQSIINDVLFESFVIKSIVDNQIVQMYDMVRSIVNARGAGEFLVFTTNYDNVLERYCHKKNLSIVNGFVEGGRGIFIWADRWSTGATNYMRMLKLHGSTFWHEDVDGKIVESGVSAPRGGKKDMIIAPTEGSKDYGDEPFHSLFERFKKEIDGVDVLLVIGSSFRDTEINKIIKRRLDEGMILISVSPSAPEDIMRISDAEHQPVVDWNNSQFAVLDSKIALCDKKFGPDTIKDVSSTLNAVFMYFLDIKAKKSRIVS